MSAGWRIWSWPVMRILRSCEEISLLLQSESTSYHQTNEIHSIFLPILCEAYPYPKIWLKQKQIWTVWVYPIIKLFHRAILRMFLIPRAEVIKCRSDLIEQRKPFLYLQFRRFLRRIQDTCCPNFWCSTFAVMNLTATLVFIPGAVPEKPLTGTRCAMCGFRFPRLKFNRIL